ncbi:kti12, chromatin associated [Terramyces sp. JEL0728]|nr:kti12, chromatin associated [Terramyces sp. JEL0728]
MPLITISGLPLSGKTTRANEIAKYLEDYISKNQTSIRKIITVNDESLSIDKKAAYIDANSEKKARGALLSAVERHLSREDIVICDGLNYIKGFRYQLYCVARALGTPTCTVFCGFDANSAVERNSNLDKYDAGMLENLCSRFEEPDGRNRWDAPLFIVIPKDESLAMEGNATSNGIVEAAILKKAPAPNLSTVVKPLLETNYLHELDKTTSNVLDVVIDAQKNGRSGDIKVPRSSVPVHLPSRNISLAELRRLKRQFMNINKTHTSMNMDQVSTGFAEYLTTNLD